MLDMVILDVWQMKVEGAISDRCPLLEPLLERTMDMAMPTHGEGDGHGELSLERCIDLTIEKNKDESEKTGEHMLEQQRALYNGLLGSLSTTVPAHVAILRRIRAQCKRGNGLLALRVILEALAP